MNEDPHTQVDAFLDILYQRFGVSENDIKRWVRVVPQLIDAHERSARYGEFLAKTVMGALAVSLVGGIVGAVGWSLLHFLRELTGG